MQQRARVRKAALRALCGGLIALAFCLPTPAAENDPADDANDAGTIKSIGFSYLSLDGPSVTHATHPDDEQILGSGSAGTTSVDAAYFLSLLYGWSWDLGQHPAEAHVLVGALLGTGIDEKRAENDNRASGSESQIFSLVFPIVPELSIGASYRFTDKLSAGLEALLSLPVIVSGWNRFDSREWDSSDLAVAFTVGPSLTFRVADGLYLAASYGQGFGDASYLVSGGLAWTTPGLLPRL